ncbi:hypothetical protein HSIEG1_1549 [Enterococcus sp. HSIEG1]|nr:hypothetical protein HSIEG1_1549 [Enterococcus sp. HSIEG1]
MKKSRRPLIVDHSFCFVKKYSLTNPFFYLFLFLACQK